MAPVKAAASGTALARDAADPTLLEAVLRRDRFILISGLVIVIMAAWTWILPCAGTGMDAAMRVAMPQQPVPGSMGGGMAMDVMTPAVWTPAYAALTFSMWWIMMIAMMLPSAAPMLLLFARVNRKEKAGGRLCVPTVIFAGGYMVDWGMFSA